jgi:hypothetical protein
VHLARKEDFPNPKIERWVYKMQDYQYELLYKSGSENQEADMLSRQIHYFSDFVALENYDPPDQPFKLIAHIFQFLVLQQNLPGVDAKLMQKVCHHARNYRFAGQILYRKRAGQWVHVPTIAERPALLREAHDGRGHFGTRATFQYLNERYWWPQFYQDCALYVAAYLPCQEFDKQTINYAPCYTSITQLFEKWAVDYVGPLPTTATGNSCCRCQDICKIPFRPHCLHLWPAKANDL